MFASLNKVALDAYLHDQFKELGWAGFTGHTLLQRFNQGTQTVGVVRLLHDFDDHHIDGPHDLRAIM